MKTPGTVLREARERHGVSQASLARRAGTTQSAISRIERDRVSPRVETLTELLHLMGDELELASAAYDFGHDRSLFHSSFRLSPAERLRRASDMGRFALNTRGILARTGRDD